jgi:hypothetical protein
MPQALFEATRGKAFRTLKRLLIVSFSDLAVDPRVNRQVRLLRDRYHVTAAGYADPGVAGVEFVRIPWVAPSPVEKLCAAAKLKSGQYERFYWSWPPVAAAKQFLSARRFDLVLANEVHTVPLALTLVPDRVVLDSHEYSPRELEDDWKWRFFFQRYVTYLCHQYIPRTAAMITVCEGIADEYATQFGKRPAVVHNTAWLAKLVPAPLEGGRVRLVHHGGAIPQRRIELMIEMMAYLEPRFSMDFYLIPTNPRYLSRLQRLAAGDSRIRFLPPVPMLEIPRTINGYDIGVFLLEPGNFNYRHALPNKLFEFIQGRIAIAIGPSPEMARLVRQYDCGVVADDFSPRALAERLSAITAERVDYYKRRSHAAAAKLCYENSSQTLISVLASVTEPRC